MNYAAFLRGINLGSRRRVASNDLRSWFEGMGFEDVSTFRTSGNVVFGTGRRPRSKLTTEVEAALTKRLGFEVTVFLRTDKEMRVIAKHQPFPARLVKASKGKLQVALLAAKPAQRLRRDVMKLSSDDDKLAFGDMELYWLPSGGTRDSGLDYGEVENLLGSTTRRTKGTLEEMVRKHLSP